MKKRGKYQCPNKSERAVYQCANEVEMVVSVP